MTTPAQDDPFLEDAIRRFREPHATVAGNTLLPEDLDRFEMILASEYCPMSIMGTFKPWVFAGLLSMARRWTRRPIGATSLGTDAVAPRGAYCILDASEPFVLVGKVNDFIREGWVPFGGVSVTHCYDPKPESAESGEDGGLLFFYAQAMVKP